MVLAPDVSLCSLIAYVFKRIGISLLPGVSCLFPPAHQALYHKLSIYLFVVALILYFPFLATQSIRCFIQPPLWVAAYQSPTDEFTVACISIESADDVNPAEATWLCKSSSHDVRARGGVPPQLGGITFQISAKYNVS